MSPVNPKPSKPSSLPQAPEARKPSLFRVVEGSGTLCGSPLGWSLDTHKGTIKGILKGTLKGILKGTLKGILKGT